MASIKVSQLDTQTQISSSDFFPVVNSSSLITYRTYMSTLETMLGLPQISMSWTSQSISSSYSLSSSYPPYPQISMSWASRSLSSSYSLSASYSPFSQQIFQPTCSWVSQSVSSSYALSASWAPLINSMRPISCSLANSESVSSSYALSASWAPNTISSQFIPQYITPVLVFSRTGSVDTNLNITQSYVVPESINYSSGLIIQSTSSIFNGGGGQFGIFSIKTDKVPLTTFIGSMLHGTAINTTFIPLNSRNITIYASVVNFQGPIGVFIIGYY